MDLFNQAFFLLISRPIHLEAWIAHVHLKVSQASQLFIT